MRDLQRTRGIIIDDWAWILEWHRDGYPHWHLFVNVAKKGKAGMIGHEGINYYWKAGQVWEGPIKNARHWKQMTGYFAKTGYFEKKKAHQAILPEWAREMTRAIRRTGSKAMPNPQSRPEKAEKFLLEEKKKENGSSVKDYIKAVDIGGWIQNEAKGVNAEPKTHGEKLDECGEAIEVHVIGTIHGKLGAVTMPYKHAKRFPGTYLEGVGFVVDLDGDFLTALYNVLDWEQKMILIEHTHEGIFASC